MSFIVKDCYNLDLLNFINVLTADKFYVNCHKRAFKKYYPLLTDKTKQNIQEIVRIHGRTNVSHYLTAIISAVPDFDNANLVELLGNTNQLGAYYSKYSYYDSQEWDEKKEIFNLLVEVLKDIEQTDFREEWLRQRLPRINSKKHEIMEFANNFHINDEIENLLGIKKNNNDIILYLCSLAYPHGIKICGSKFISDIRYSKQFTLRIAIHELFHPPYNTKNIEYELQCLAKDNLIEKAFKSQLPNFAYSNIIGFIEENVVEAMELFISKKIGLVHDELMYLKKHDNGSHVFSFILLKYFREHQKDICIPFEEYFKGILKVMPIGSLQSEYDEIINSVSCKNPISRIVKSLKIIWKAVVNNFFATKPGKNR